MNPRETFEPDRFNAGNDPLDDRGLDEPAPTDIRTAGTTEVLAGDDEALGRPGLTNAAGQTSGTQSGAGTSDGSPRSSADELDDR